jgi:hypothetical protein
MQVASVRKPTTGVLISESPLQEEFEEQQKREEQLKIKVMAGVNRTENNKIKFPTLGELEAWRKTIQL